MKLLTELSFLRGKEPARPPRPIRASLPYPPPSSGPGGQCPPGTSQPNARPGQPAPPPRPPATPAPRAQRCFSLSLFVGCGRRGLCSGAPQASQRPGPLLPPPPPAAPRQCGHRPLLPSLSGLNQIPSSPVRPAQWPVLSPASLRCSSGPRPLSLVAFVLWPFLLFSLTFVSRHRAFACPPWFPASCLADSSLPPAPSVPSFLFSALLPWGSS